MKNRLQYLVLLAVLGSFLIAGSYSFGIAQTTSQQMRYAMSGDSVYVYHIKSLRPGQGFNIYRRDSDAEEFRQLNDEVIRGITYASELPSALGEEIYSQIQQNIDAENVSDIFFKLGSNAVTGRLYTFVYPEVARALGRLFIDDFTTVGGQVTYRIEFVNDLGEATGDTITETFTLDEHTPQPPSDLQIENEGYQATAQWQYPQMGSEDDKVIRFNLYRQNPANGETERINQNVIIRESDKSEYTHYFRAQSLGQRIDYFVTAVDITGQRGPFSERVSHYVADNIPPSTISGVEAEYIDGSIEITWPVSPEPDLAGYFIYKSRDIQDGYQKLNATPVNILQTVYRDSSIQDGDQYYFKVTAVDSAGNESAPSAAAMRMIADSSPPPQPEILQLEFDEETGVNLSWQLSPSPEDLRRFIVLRSRAGDPAYSQLTRREFRGFNFADAGEADKGFAEGAFYRYGIVAADSSRNFSDTTFAEIQIPDLTPPEKPSFVRADNEEGIRVNVSWNATSSGDAVTYIAYRQPLDSSLTQLRELPINQTAFRHEQVDLGQRYRYAISAVDSVGNESQPTFSDTVWVRDYDPPRSVRNVRAQPVESGGYQISWEPVVANDLNGYKVYYSNISTGVYQPLTEEVISNTSFVDTNGSAGRWYRVVAVDISGNESKPNDPVKAQ